MFNDNLAAKIVLNLSQVLQNCYKIILEFCLAEVKYHFRFLP